MPAGRLCSESAGAGAAARSACVAGCGPPRSHWGGAPSEGPRACQGRFKSGPLLPIEKWRGSASRTLVGSLGWSGVGGGPHPSADPLCQLDDDSLGAADVAEPVAVLVALQLADELGAAGSQAGDDR